MEAGNNIDSYLLKNLHGMEVEVLNYGAIIRAIRLPYQKGVINLVLSYDHLQDYLTDPYYLGAIIGRYCNRICNGQFSINGQAYQISQNEGSNHLHGGKSGFNKKFWHIVPPGLSIRSKEQSITLKYVAKDGEEGYPGNLSVTVRYTLNSNNQLLIEYSASTDYETLVNLSNHSYFNLNKNDEGIENHEITINADFFTPVNQQLIPTGSITAVNNTPFDFRRQTSLKASLNSEHEQMVYGSGYDHNFILKRPYGGMAYAASAFSPQSGVEMRVYTSKPGLQFYSGNHLDTPFKQREGLCFETQIYPDSPNKPHFPSALLRPNDVYQERTMYEFRID